MIRWERGSPGVEISMNEALADSNFSLQGLFCLYCFPALSL